MSVKRALVAAPLPPEFDRASGSKVIYDMIEFLLQDGWAVSFVAENARPHGGERYLRILRQRGVATYDGIGDRTDELIADGRFDVAICGFWYMAERLLPRLRSLSPQTRVMVHMIDFHFLRDARRVLGAGGQLDVDHGANLAREVNVYSACDGILAVSAKEAELVQDLIGGTSRTFVLPLYEEPVRSSFGFDERHGMVFIGNYKHPPNVEAVDWLLNEIVPLLPSGLLVDHPLRIIGNELPESLRRLGEGISGVEMVGWVPSLLPYLQRARLSIVPLRHGAGTKGKVIQTLAAGTPVVSTAIGLEGLDLRHGEHAIRADDARSFADAVAGLIHNRERWTRLEQAGRAAVASRHGRDEVRNSFRDAIGTILQRDVKKAVMGEEGRQLADRLVKPHYRELVSRVRKLAADVLPPGSSVAVLSRGDDELLRLGQAHAEHFPSDDSGSWLGWYPADGKDAVRMLKEAAARGVRFLVLPKTAAWWLDHYPEFAQVLQREWHEIQRDADVCVVYALDNSGPHHSKVDGSIPKGLSMRER